MGRVSLCVVALLCIGLPAVPAGWTDVRSGLADRDETFNYDVSWSEIVTAGRAQLRIGNAQTASDGHTSLRMEASLRPTSLAARMYKVAYRIENLFDATAARPLAAAAFTSEGGVDRTRSIQFNRNGTADVELRTQRTTRERFVVPSGTLDVLGAVYALRTSRKAPGESLVLPVFDGVRVSTVHVTFGARKLVATGFGQLPAIEVVASLRNEASRTESGPSVRIWLSDDPMRRPLRIESALPVGRIVLSLTK